METSSSTISTNPRQNLLWEIGETITKYFVLEKKWHSEKRGKKIFFDEDDSKRIAQLVLMRLEKQPTP